MSNDFVQGQVGYVSERDELPERAMLLSQDDILNIQKRTIDNWKPAREMYILKHGSFILGIGAALTGIIYNTKFRALMKLRARARIPSFGPVLFFPFVITSTSQDMIIKKDISLGVTPCPTCLMVRSTLLQLASGLLQPFLLSLISSASLAKSFATYPLPPLRDYKSTFNVFLNMSKTMKVPTACLVGFHVASISMVVYGQSEAVQKVNRHVLGKESYLK